MKLIRILFIVFSLSITLTACTPSSNPPKVEESENNAKEEERQSVMNVSIDEAKELIETENELFILDVRTKDEFDAGHIDDAVQIPVDELGTRIDEIIEYKENPVLVYCRSGRRSRDAAEILKENGFTNIYNLSDGFMRWK